MKPQTAQALLLLRAHPEGVTQLRALEEIGSFRLAARVGELRGMGYRIDTEWMDTLSGKRVARYRLVEQEKAAS